jgi:hypothetical protein
VEQQISSRDMEVIDNVLQMGSGYVLNFSDKTFARFFREVFGIDIDDQAYKTQGASKAKRLRTFLQSTSPPLVGQVLDRLLEHRLRDVEAIIDEATLARYRVLAAEFGGTGTAPKSAVANDATLSPSAALLDERMGRLRTAVEQVEREDARKRDHVAKLSKQFAEQCARANLRSRTKNMVFSEAGDETVYGFLGAGPEGLYIAYRSSSADLEDAANGFEPTFASMEPLAWPIEWVRSVTEQHKLDELMDAMDEQLRALATPAMSITTAPDNGESKIRRGRRAPPSVGEAIGLVHVLAVGVSDYDPASNFGPLQQCVHDAVEVARCFRDSPQLHSRGDLVRELTSAGAVARGHIIKELRALAARANPDERLVFYFSGTAAV